MHVLLAAAAAECGRGAGWRADGVSFPPLPGLAGYLCLAKACLTDSPTYPPFRLIHHTAHSAHTSQDGLAWRLWCLGVSWSCSGVSLFPLLARYAPQCPPRPPPKIPLICTKQIIARTRNPKSLFGFVFFERGERKTGTGSQT